MKVYKLFKRKGEVLWSGKEGNYGKEYGVGLNTHDGEVKCCHSGLHACPKLKDVFKYRKPAPDIEIWECIAGGKIDPKDDKVACSELTLVRKLELPDCLKDWGTHAGWAMVKTLGYEITQSTLDNLTGLDLSDNQLTEVPKEIGNMTALTSLDLCDNQLTEVPKEIGKLTNLISLDLCDNQLTEVPKAIGKLKALTWLYLHGNQLKTKAIQDLKKPLPNCTIYS